jgi:hypothetical protein
MKKIIAEFSTKGTIKHIKNIQQVLFSLFTDLDLSFLNNANDSSNIFIFHLVRVNKKKEHYERRYRNISVPADPETLSQKQARCDDAHCGLSYWRSGGRKIKV